MEYKRTKPKVIKLDAESILDFGSLYKGKTISYIMENDMDYLKWLYKNVKQLRFSKDILAKLK
jgi:hypothetical protein